jgi:hypothetical protein
MLEHPFTDDCEDLRSQIRHVMQDPMRLVPTWWDSKTFIGADNQQGSRIDFGIRIVNSGLGKKSTITNPKSAIVLTPQRLYAGSATGGMI